MYVVAVLLKCVCLYVESLIVTDCSGYNFACGGLALLRIQIKILEEIDRRVKRLGDYIAKFKNI